MLAAIFEAAAFNGVAAANVEEAIEEPTLCTP